MKSLLLYVAFFFCLFSSIVSMFIAASGYPLFYVLFLAGGACTMLFMEELKRVES